MTNSLRRAVVALLVSLAASLPALYLALAALPGATDSVIVALSNSNLNSNVGLAIFDAGVMRPNSASNTIYDNEVLFIQVDGSKSEVYAGGPSSYNTYTYDRSGLTAKASLSNLGTTSYSQDEMQLISGKLFTDLGRVYDAEAGALLASLYSGGQTLARGRDSGRQHAWQDLRRR